MSLPLDDLFDDAHSLELDDRGSRLVVGRTPGDQLRVSLGRDSLVFSPGETLRFEVSPHLLSVAPDTKVRIETKLVRGRTSSGNVVGESDVTVGDRVGISQEVRLPDEEGVYDLLVTATNPSWANPVRKIQPLAVRRIQLLVLRPEAPVVPPGSPPEWSLVEEIDPAHPKLRERLPKLPDPLDPLELSRLWKGSFGNGNRRTRAHPLGQLVELGPNLDAGDAAWEAYTLPISRPGQPHVLEVDYPSDVPQTIGVSIIESDPAGDVFPVGLDSGIELADEVAGTLGPVKWLRHRVVFWPKTKSPLVLITNRRDGSPAVYGKIRVLTAGEHLPPFPAHGASPEAGGNRPDASPRAQRLLAAYLDRPLFPENFSASHALASQSQLGVDDWTTFYEGGTRLVEYLNHAGFGGLMVSVLADGSTLYPSALLQPTPRYDTGVFQEAGQDPVRKDVLEMLFRLFDRRRLELIPAMEFAAPLPELEAELRRGGPETKGLVWVGAEGKTWLETYRPVREAAPYYNTLHPRVQEAMLVAIREVLKRYGHHPSFAGLAIQLSGRGYAQLPGPNWGMDDVTIARFEQEAQIQVPGEGPGRFAERARFLATQCPRQWLDWRAAHLSRFHRRIQAELAASVPNARLYLSGANMLTGREIERSLRPALPREMTISEAMLRVGIDVTHYGGDQPIVLMCPKRIAPDWSLARQAVNLEIKQMLETEGTPFENAPIPGSLFFHEPQELRLASFDEKSPFSPSRTWLVTQPVPSHHQNRRRFIHSLATLDSQVIFDGGWQLPLGQEDSIRNVVAAYRRLPAIRFRRLTDEFGSDRTQPVTIRYASHAGATYLYLVNDAPFATVARVSLDCPTGCRLEELSGLRKVPPLEADTDRPSWTVELDPYDLVAVRLLAPDVTVYGPRVSWSEDVQKELASRIVELRSRFLALRNPPILDVVANPSFDEPPATDGEIVGWTSRREPGVFVGLDETRKRVGDYSAKLTSRGPTASLVSQPFDAPSTGRLTMSVWLSTADASKSPPLQLVLEGYHKGQYYSRYANPTPSADWGSFPFVVRVDDLPLDGLSRLRIRFDLTGPGEVWIDDVQLSDLEFSKAENNALLKLILPANGKLENRQVRDCIHLLEGYWPRFLMANVPLREAPVAQKAQPTPRAPKEPPADPSLLDKVKAFLPQRLRFF